MVAEAEKAKETVSEKTAVNNDTDIEKESSCINALKQKKFDSITLDCYSKNKEYFRKEKNNFCTSVLKKHDEVQKFISRNKSAASYLDTCKAVFTTLCKKTNNHSECTSKVTKHECDKSLPIPNGFKLVEENSELTLVAIDPE